MEGPGAEWTGSSADAQTIFGAQQQLKGIQRTLAAAENEISLESAG